MATNASNFGRTRTALRGTIDALPPVSGNVYFVDSVTGSAAGGYTMDGPAATLTQALALVTAANNDRIVVFGTHAETIVGAAGVSIAKSGVQIVGLGQGRLRPTFTFTTSVAASFDVSAANVQIQNLVFVTGIDNQTAVNNVTAADVQFLNCEWAISNGTVGAAVGILTAATADRLLVDGSVFRGPAVNAGTTCAGCIQHESGVDVIVRNNIFQGKMTQAIKNVATVLRGQYYNNAFTIGTGTVAMTFAAASTPSFYNNRYNLPSGTTPVTAAAGFNLGGNYYSAAAGVAAGTLI